MKPCPVSLDDASVPTLAQIASLESVLAPDDIRSLVTSFLAGAVLVVVLVPRFGIQGAALGLLAGSLVRLAVTVASYPAILRMTVPRLWLNRADIRRLFASRQLATA